VVFEPSQLDFVCSGGHQRAIVFVAVGPESIAEEEQAGLVVQVRVVKLHPVRFHFRGQDLNSVRDLDQDQC